MARAPTVIKVPGGGGLDQFTDPRHVEPVKLLAGENLRIPKAGSYGKRLGMDTVVAAQQTAYGPERVYGVGDQVIVGDGVNLRSYVPNATNSAVTARLRTVGSLPQALVETDALWSGNVPSIGNVAVGGGCYCVAFVASSTLYVEVYDATTNAPFGYMTTGSALASGAYRAQVVFFAGAFYVAVSYTGTGNIDLFMLPITGLSLATTTYNIITTHTTSAEFRMVATAGGILVAYQVGGGFLPTLELFSSAGVSLAGPTAPAEALTGRKVGMFLSVDGGTNSFLSYTAASGGNNYVRYSVSNFTTTATVLVGTTVSTSATDTYYSTAIYGTAATTATVAYQRISTTAGSGCYFANLTSAGVVTALANATVYWASPLSGFFTATLAVGGGQGGLNIWLSCGGAVNTTLTTYASTPVATYTAALMNLNSAGGTITAMPNGIAGPRISTFNPEGVPPVVLLTTGRYVTLLASRRDAGYRRTISLVSADYDSLDRWRGANIGDHLMLSGGASTLYDGALLREVGCAYDIQGPQGVTVAAAATANPGGTWTWCFVYAKSDRTGQVVRSAPSIGLSKTLAAGDSATFALPCLSVTADPYGGGTVIEIYRTVQGGAIFYLLDAVQNAAFSQTVNYADLYAVTDATLATRPTLYTTGGNVPNTMPPASVGVFSHKSRAFLLERDRIWFSKLYVDGDFPQFALDFTLDVPGGEIVGGVSLDDFAVIFERSKIWILTGEGPNDAGLQLDYQLRQCAADLGCTEATSLLVHSGGVFFRSGAGLYNLTRGLGVDYIGRFVEDELTSATVITGAVIHPTQHIALFSLSGGTAGRRLVYDYLHGVWLKDVCTATEKGLAVVGSSLYSVRAQGLLAKESTTYLDNGAWITFLAKFGFMESPGTEYQMARIFEATFSRVTSHGISMSIFNGYKTSADTTRAWTAAEIDALADIPVYTIDAANTYPLTDAATVQITDTAPSSIDPLVDGQGATLTGIAIDLEPQTGIVRKASANRR